MFCLIFAIKIQSSDRTFYHHQNVYTHGPLSLFLPDLLITVERPESLLPAL